MAINIKSHTNIEILANEFLLDLFAPENFAANSTKFDFLRGANVIVCENKGLQEYLKMRCVKEKGIWTFEFQPLPDLLMSCAYKLFSLSTKQDEKRNIYDRNNLVWAIYNLLQLPELGLDKEAKNFAFANELAGIFASYQIYRQNEIINPWTQKPSREYKIKGETNDSCFEKNEKWQRILWQKLIENDENEKTNISEIKQKNISQIYADIQNVLSKKTATELEEKHFPKQIFIFAPLALTPIHLQTLAAMGTDNTGIKINLYLQTISSEYINSHLSEKKIAGLRKDSWQNKIAPNEKDLYWDLGNRLIANFGRTSQVLYEQIFELTETGQAHETEIYEYALAEISSEESQEKTLLMQIQENIIGDIGEETSSVKDESLIFSSCFSPLREIEVLSDYIIDLFEKKKYNLLPEDIVVVSPNIEDYATAIDMVFSRCKIPYQIADRDVRKNNKFIQLLNMLFSTIVSRHDAPDIVELFEYSMFVQDRELTGSAREQIEKWVKENAIRYGLASKFEIPNYSFETGLNQLAAGFFINSEDEFSEIGEYCYPDIEGANAEILGEFAKFIETLKNIEAEIFEDKLNENGERVQKLKPINDSKVGSGDSWHAFICENLQAFFGSDILNLRQEDGENSFIKFMEIWSALKEEMEIGFGKKNVKIDFSVFSKAVIKKAQTKCQNSQAYNFNSKITFANIETMRSAPFKVICLIGMNAKEFPRQIKHNEMNLMLAENKLGDKDWANEDRLMFLQALLSAKNAVFISWVGQSEKNTENLDPSSVILTFFDNLQKQYGLQKEDLITLHPLQPFSKKYFEKNTSLTSYDARWAITEKSKTCGNKIWNWRLEKNLFSQEQRDDIDKLYRILSNVPKYFLKDLCNIELPQNLDVLESEEPFFIEKGLNEWKLNDLILQTEPKTLKIEILKAQLRGELPAGKIATQIIEKKIEKMHKLKEFETLGVKTFIKPSRDKGKYRLWHWLKHLEYNVANEASNTEFILLSSDEKKQLKLQLPALSPIESVAEIDRLWTLADKLKEQIMPIFPNVAWEYCRPQKEGVDKIKNAEKKIFGDGFNTGIAEYCEYTKKALGGARNFAELSGETDRDLASEFAWFSTELFKKYNDCGVVEIKL